MNDFVTTDTVHILATAGLHIGLIVLLLRWTGHMLGSPRKLTAATSIGLLWVYDVMAGGRPAVTRAIVVASIYLAATIIERTPDVLTSLAAGALIILFLQPTALLEPGFQMSFLTVLALTALMPIWQHYVDPIHERFKGKVRWLSGKALDLTGMCLVAQLGAGPIVAAEFHVVGLLSVIANLIVVPLVLILIPSGLAVMLLSQGWISGASLLAKLTVAPLVGAILAVTHLFSSFDGASVPVADIPGWTLISYYVLVCGGGFVWQNSIAKKRRLALHSPVVPTGAHNNVMRQA